MDELNTQNNPDRTNEESRFLVPEGITWPAVEQILLNRTPMPRQLATRPLSYPGMPAVRFASDQMRADPPATHKSTLQQPYLRRAVCPGYGVAFGDRLLQEIAAASAAKQQVSYSKPWAPRNIAQVPVFSTIPVTVLSVTVPQGYTWWIDGYAFDLFPSTTNELNYIYEIFVNGWGILNHGVFPPPAGRPIFNNQKVPIGFTKQDKVPAYQGNLVEVVVRAAATLGASDSISATLFGTLQATLDPRRVREAA